MDNKEAIESLKKYLLSQNQKDVVHLTACMMIDINRFLNYDRLDMHERNSLLKRSKHNVKEMIKYLKNPQTASLILKQTE